MLPVSVGSVRHLEHRMLVVVVLAVVGRLPVFRFVVGGGGVRGVGSEGVVAHEHEHPLAVAPLHRRQRESEVARLAWLVFDSFYFLNCFIVY